MAIPTRETRFLARSDADFAFAFQRLAQASPPTPLDLAGWTLRFVVKARPTDADAALVAENAEIVRVDASAGRARVVIDRAVLAGALPAEALRCEWHAALQAQGPGGEDEVWAAGPFVLLRGL